MKRSAQNEPGGRTVPVWFSANPFDRSSAVDSLDPTTPSPGVDNDGLREKIIAALRQVYDPEIPVNIYDLGLIYRIDIDAEGAADLDMTLTAPGCPVAQTFPSMVQQAVLAVEGVTDASVDLVWDPPWTQDRMTDEVKLELGLL